MNQSALKLVLADSDVDLAGDLAVFLRGQYAVIQVLSFRQAMAALSSQFSILIVAADFCIEPDAERTNGPCTAGTLMSLALSRGHNVLTLGVVPETPAAVSGRNIICLDRYPVPHILQLAVERLLPEEATFQMN